MIMKKFFTDPLCIIFTLLFLLAISTPFFASYIEKSLQENPGNFTVYLGKGALAKVIQVRGYEFEKETGYFCFRLMNGQVLRVKDPYMIINNTKEAWTESGD